MRVGAQRRLGPAAGGAGCDKAGGSHRRAGGAI